MTYTVHELYKIFFKQMRRVHYSENSKANLPKRRHAPTSEPTVRQQIMVKEKMNKFTIQREFISKMENVDKELARIQNALTDQITEKLKSKKGYQNFQKDVEEDYSNLYSLDDTKMIHIMDEWFQLSPKMKELYNNLSDDNS